MPEWPQQGLLAGDERFSMKDQETIARFIQLRASGWSFARIASEINVSKPTLIQWSRTYQFEIQNLRAVETEALAENSSLPARSAGPPSENISSASNRSWPNALSIPSPPLVFSAWPPNRVPRSSAKLVKPASPPRPGLSQRMN